MHSLSTHAVGRRLAMAGAAAIAALAFAIALPGDASAATVAWSSVNPSSPPGQAICGPSSNVSGRYNPTFGTINGYATVNECIRWYRSSGGTYYYQGVLKLVYHEIKAPERFGGKSMSLVSGNPYAVDGVNDCPSKIWTTNEVGWCYAPTSKISGAGHKLYGKGYAIDYAGAWHPVWSPVITTF